MRGSGVCSQAGVNIYVYIYVVSDGKLLCTWEFLNVFADIFLHKFAQILVENEILF